MPCILCKCDAKLTERILLEDCSVKTKQFYEENYFTNWEYNFVCRRCYWKDSFRRARGNLVGLILSLAMRLGMVFASSLIAWSFLYKFKYKGDVMFYGPVIFSAIATLIFYRYMLKIVLGTIAIAMIMFSLIYGAAYSDAMSFLPDMGAVVQRERMKQGTAPTKSAAKSGKTTKSAPVDPLRASEERKSRQRQASIKRSIKTLEKYLPFYLRLKFKHLQDNIRPSLYGFALLYAILLPWHFIFVPIYRQIRERRRPKER